LKFIVCYVTCATKIQGKKLRFDDY